MSKMIGAVLIIAGGTSIAMQKIESRRRSLQTLQALINALRTIECAIRWKGQTLPECFCIMKKDEYCGKYFGDIHDLLESNQTLQTAWHKAFTNIEKDVRDIILQMDWDGDERHISGNLQYISEGLIRLYSDRRTRKRNEDKLLLAAIGSCTVLLVIILL